MKYLNKFVAFATTIVLMLFMFPLSYANIACADEPQDIYVYLKVTGNTEGLVINNTKLWYTIGQIKADIPESTQYKQEHPDTYSNYIHDYDSEIQSKILSSIERYTHNRSLDLTKADWSTKGLKIDQGATDYINGKYVWHYDGDIDVKYLTHYFIYYVDTEGNEIYKTIEGAGVDEDVVTGEQKTIHGYNLVSSTNTTITLDHTKENKIVFTYEKIPTYDVTWKDYDGTVLEKDTNVLEGNVPTYDSAAPTRADSDHASYEFTGWSPSISPVTGNTTYTATYKKIPYPTYNITYNWGDFDLATLPIDNNNYYIGDSYHVDAAFTKDTKIYIYDKYQNIEGVWSFSGWNADSGAINGNITISGSWSYETVEVPKWHITYVYSGTYPDGIKPPTDSTEYINGSEYNLISNKDNLIIRYDKRGNRIGHYVFSGWDQLESGTITENMVVTGNWEYVDETDNPIVVPKDNNNDSNNFKKTEKIKQTATSDNISKSPQTGDLIGYFIGGVLLVFFVLALFYVAVKLKRKGVI